MANVPVINTSSVAFDIKEKIATLQASLLSAHPGLPVLLREIYTKLDADKSLVTLMSEEEIGIIVKGLTRQTAMEIVVASIGKKGPRKPAAQQISLEDL